MARNNMRMDIKIIKEKLNEVIKQQKLNASFNKVISQDEIRHFEEKYDISLPKGYRQFLTEIGNGGPGPNWGILSLQESVIDFKLVHKPPIDIASNFKYKSAWNETWIDSIDLEEERPDDDLFNQYIDVSHISGCLQISDCGHGCTNLLVIKGDCKGQIWSDGRAFYEGITPEKNEENHTYTFLEWYDSWLNDISNGSTVFRSLDSFISG